MLATEREHVGQGAAPTAAPQHQGVSPGRHALAGDRSETGKEAGGSNYSSATLFDSDGGGDSGGGDAPVALKVADSVGAGGEKAAGVHGAENPTDVAEEGFQGKGGPLPFQAQLERSFGVPLGGVQAHTDENAQHASGKLGADAYASGNRVAFATPNPSMPLVAHELTHVLQHTGKGPAKKSTNGGAGGIETSGEHEAEAVESAVAAGRPASSALQGEAGKVGEGKGGAPSLKAGQKPALSTPFSTGMTFSPTSFEQSASYSLWDAPQFRVPIATVPGLSFCVSPSVSVGVGGGVDWKKQAVTSRLTVDGGVGVSLNYGLPAVAEMYGGMEASASGGFNYERTRGGGDSQSKSIRARDTWSLDGSITLSANLMCGVKLGGGILDKKFQFGRVEIGKLTGLKWENGQFQRGATGWAWGAKPLQLFREIKQAIDHAKYILTLPAKAAAEAWKGMKNAGGWAAGRLYSGVTSILGGIGDAAGTVGRAINPFD